LAKSASDEQRSLDIQIERAGQAAAAAAVRFSADLDYFREQRRRCSEMVRVVGCSKEELRELLDQLTNAKEDCAIGWRGLDEDEAHHAVLAQELDVKRQRQAAEASAAAAAASLEAAAALKQRVARASTEHAAAAERCRHLSEELKEAEEGCTVLNHVLQRGLGDQGVDSARDKALREEDAETVAYLAKVQAASAAAGDAAAQSASAVGAAEEEVVRLTELLCQARADCVERSRNLKLVAEGVERSCTDHRRSELELAALLQEIQKLNQAQVLEANKAWDGGASCEADLWAARERREETLTREQMLLLQHLRGSQRGGAGAGTAGTGALEVLRDLRERQLISVSTLSAEEDLVCAEVRNAMEAAATEKGSSDQQLKLELEAVRNEREVLLAKLESDEESWQLTEQRLRKQIRTLKGEPDSNAAIDDDTIARMRVVMRDARKFLDEQQFRVDVARKERDEVRNRLVDTLSHLEGPEYAQLVVETASRAAASDRPPSEDVQVLDTEPVAVMATMAAQLGYRKAPALKVPFPYQPPPTIDEEEPMG
jgi:hypothetical protein